MKCFHWLLNFYFIYTGEAQIIAAYFGNVANLINALMSTVQKDVTINTMRKIGIPEACIVTFRSWFKYYGSLLNLKRILKSVGGVHSMPDKNRIKILNNANNIMSQCVSDITIGRLLHERERTEMAIHRKRETR